jgi:hypothetical protein
LNFELTPSFPWATHCDVDVVARVTGARPLDRNLARPLGDAIKLGFRKLNCDLLAGAV